MTGYGPRFAAVLVALSVAILLPAPAVASGVGAPPAGIVSPNQNSPEFDAAAEYREGVNALKASDYRKAEVAFRHVLSMAPNSAPTLVRLGMALEGQGDLKAARRAYEKAIRSDGSLVAAHRQLGLVVVRLGDADKAKVELAWLRQRVGTCGETCGDAAEAHAALADLQAASAPAPAPSSTTTAAVN